MKKVIRHRLRTTITSNRFEACREIKQGKMETDEIRYIKKMCSECKYYVEESCLKKYAVIECARKGLKWK